MVKNLMSGPTIGSHRHGCLKINFGSENFQMKVLCIHSLSMLPIKRSVVATIEIKRTCECEVAFTNRNIELSSFVCKLNKLGHSISENFFDGI